MSQYVCSVCGYIYDEAKGIPDSGIAPGTAFDDLPDGWVCPLCGATKMEFEKKGEQQQPRKVQKASNEPLSASDTVITASEISALCSNLARGYEKQYQSEAAAQYAQLAFYFKNKAGRIEQTDYQQLISAIEQDLSEGFANANRAASAAADRGAMRALVWSEKVTRIQKSILNRYQNEGDKLLAGKSVFVCSVCGFIYIGESAPDLCPVCKVPNWKFETVEGGE